MSETQAAALQPVTAERPVGMRIGHVAHYLGISRSTLNRLREQKLFPPPRKQIGKLKLWHVDDVDRWFGDADLQAKVAAVRGKERVR